MDTPFNGKISLKLCTESLAHKSDFLAEAVKKSNSKKIEFSSTSHLNPVDFFIFLFSSSCLSVTIILSDNTVRNIKVTPKAVEVKIYQKLSVQRNYPFNEIYSIRPQDLVTEASCRHTCSQLIILPSSQINSTQFFAIQTQIEKPKVVSQSQSERLTTWFSLK